MQIIEVYMFIRFFTCIFLSIHRDIIAVFAIHLRVYDVEIATVDFCGFTNVHRGFKEKLMAMLESTLAEFNEWNSAPT